MIQNCALPWPSCGLVFSLPWETAMHCIRFQRPDCLWRMLISSQQRENYSNLQCYQLFWKRQSVNPVATAENCSHVPWSFNPGPGNGTSAASICCWVLSTALRRRSAGTNAASRWAVSRLGWTQKHLLWQLFVIHGGDAWATATSLHSSQSNSYCHIPSLFCWDSPYQSSLLIATSCQWGSQG